MCVCRGTTAASLKRTKSTQWITPSGHDVKAIRIDAVLHAAAWASASWRLCPDQNEIVLTVRVRLTPESRTRSAQELVTNENTHEGMSLAIWPVDSRLGCIREEDVTSQLGLLLAVVIATSAAACSGGSESMSPTGPSGARGAQIAGRVSGVNMSSTASINGLSAGPLTQTTTSSGPLKVSINGTNIETSVDGTGHFTLNGVPAGTIVLNFSGRGVNASVTLRGVSTGDQIEIDVRLENGGARLESDHRRRGDNDNDDDNESNNEGRRLPEGTIEVEGAVSTLTGSCPALAFRLGSTTVATSSSTIFDNITCAAIRNATRLEVIGRPQADGVLVATKVYPED